MPLTVSIVVPVHNMGADLGACLKSLAWSTVTPLQCIVVDDMCTDSTLGYATGFDVRIIANTGRKGPAHARNVGTLSASGDIILFVDADVTLHPDAVERVLAAFHSDPQLDAVFGAYDDEPETSGLVSQFRNLLHCFVHRTSRRQASTFWAGCGAVRRESFLRNDGFDVAYGCPSIEDIEFGARLIQNGGRIELDPEIQAKHHKRWTLKSMVSTDIWCRGVPWTRLLLASGSMPNDLNVSVRNRCSVALAGLAAVGVAGLAARIAVSGLPQPPIYFLMAPVSIALLVALNLDFYRFLAARRGGAFAIAAVPLHWLHLICCGVSFAIGSAQHWAAQLTGAQVSSVSAKDSRR